MPFDRSNIFDRILSFLNIGDKEEKPLKNVLPEANGDPRDEQKPHKDEIANVVRQLYEDGEQFMLDHWQDTNRTRPRWDSASSYTFGTPTTMRDMCDLLEAGNNWEVWGRRNTSDKTRWRQEKVDGEINRQMRARKRFITSNWHDVQITPNINHIKDIFDQEREKGGWGMWVKKYVATAQKYGTATTRIYLDKSKDPDGVVRNMVCVPGSVMRTPYSESYEKVDGCWYTVVLSMMTDQMIREVYGIEPETAGMSESEKVGKVDTRKVRKYTHTKFYTKLELFADDPTIERVPVTDQDRLKILEDDQELLSGRQVQAAESENHSEHVKYKLTALKSHIQQEPENEQDALVLNNIIDVYMANIEEHLAMMKDKELETMGYRHVYPDGRYICVLGSIVVQDIPNPYKYDWRQLFRDLKNEEVEGRIDGRGDPEILWNEEREMDTSLSRIADLVLTVGMPKKYKHVADKEITDDVEENDPTKPGYFKQVPPTFVKGEVPREEFEVYKLRKENSQRTNAVNDTTFGKEPGGQASGVMVDLLQRQNEVMVTGEIDGNLREAMKDIIETWIGLYRIFYTEPREYFLESKLQEVNVSELLTFQDNQRITKFEIDGKPFSNYPQRWENELAFLVQLAGVKDEEGFPIIPSEAILDHLAIKYPEYGTNGKYRKVSQALKIGMAVLQRQQQLALEEKKSEDALAGVVQNFERSQFKKELEQGGNGQR